MFTRDYRDMAGGVGLFAVGAFMILHVSANYELGTFRSMGPGMFPMGLGYLMVGFGILLFIQALFQPGTLPEIRIWSPLFVLAGTAAFAIFVRPFGLIPAILAVTIISSFAQLKVYPVSLAILCTVLCIIAWLAFKVGLGLPVLMFRWPF